MWSYRLASRWDRFRHASSRLAFRKCLQRSCKVQKVFCGVCSVPAKSKKFFVAFAAFLQSPESFSRHLQHRCKHQKISRSICNTVASAKKFFEAFATPLQTPKKNLGAFATLLQTFSFQRTKLFTKSLAPDPLLTPF